MSEREIVKILAAARFKPRSDTLANWESKNPILLSGEPGVVIDGTETNKIKFGDGVTPWNELGWWKGPKGDKGDNGVSGVYVGSGDMPEGYNVQIDPGGVIKPEDFAISVDNKYNPNSTNAQSGIAVAEAVTKAVTKAKSEAVAEAVTKATSEAVAESNIYTDQSILNLKLLEKMQELSQSVLLAAHPVGSYYWSSQPTNPSELFGGTWKQVQGKFILAAGTYTDKNGITRSFAVGGTDTGEYSHALNVSEMPSHKHTEIFYAEHQGDLTVGGGTVRLLDSAYLFSQQPTSGASFGYFGEVFPSGGNQPHNNMPPYEVAYCWKRIN